MLRRIPFEGIENFRDLGGYAARYGETSYGVIYRSASISDATPADVEKIASLGIKTIIDLRSAYDKEHFPDKTLDDPRFFTIQLPVNGEGRVATDEDDMVRSYLEMLEDPKTARAIFLTIANAEKPCLIHCAAGKDRTGCILTVILLANGVSFEDCNAEYLSSIPYIPKLMENTLRVNPDFPQAYLFPKVTFLKRVFSEFKERWGDVDGYFEFLGLSDDEIALIKNLLGKQEKSCGAVVFHGREVLVEHMRMGHYSIPKGHVEASDKDDRDTALREIKEETGLSARIVSDRTRSFSYSPKDGVSKRVTFFVAEADTAKVVAQPEEVEDIYWLSPKDALRVLTHTTDRDTVRWATEIYADI
jgi:protein-tyrosine phosphatase